MNEPSAVLVVDDDPDMVDVIELVLQRAGYTIRRAENGAQALEAVAAEMPALILLDMLMPVMNGRQCARELRARYGRVVPIVVVSAAEHARSRGDAIDADDTLSKPFEVVDLLRIVARYVPEPKPCRR
jgi:CheY-like chemotaxis protein